MRIATFNCNSIRVRLPAILEWLESHAPDVLALQETKVVDKDFPIQDFVSRGWHVAFKGQKSYNGVAVITRDTPDLVEYGLGDNDEGVSETRLVRVRVKGVDIVNTYVPQGESLESDKFTFKLQWFNRLKKYFSERFQPERDSLVWVGDLNVAPLAMDVYDSKSIWPHVCHCQEVVDAFASVMNWGFVDVFRKHLPGPDIFTFWDYRERGSVSRNRGWRIDHILATPGMAEKSSGCQVDKEPRLQERPSDHTFVFADFDEVRHG